ncbi:MAG: hypothetical protein QOI66_726 [Myxococcales bacterium]|jgi:hypothetical protein|nr:hypothetical protein [Myxococcales bacterium]
MLAWAFAMAPLLALAAAKLQPADLPPPPAAPPSPAAPRPTTGLALTVIRVDPQPGIDCPTAGQVTTAINDRLPGTVRPDAPDAGGPTARLVLAQVSPNAIRVVLIAATGAPVLERTLEILNPQGGDRDGGAEVANPRTGANHDGTGCAALADTISLIVQRYLRHLEYRDEPTVLARSQDKQGLDKRSMATIRRAPAETPGPPPRPAERRQVLVSATGDVLGPFPEPWGASIWTPAAGLSVELAWMHWSLSAQAAIGAAVRTRALPGSENAGFSYLPVPLRIAAGWRIPLPKGTLTPTVGAGADLLFETAHGLRGSSPGVSAEPTVEGGLNYTVPVGGRAFVAAHVLADLNLRPHDFMVTGLSSPVLKTTRLYARSGLSVGVVFGDGPHSSGRP